MLCYCYGSVSDHFGPSALINLDLDLDLIYVCLDVNARTFSMERDDKLDNISAI